MGTRGFSTIEMAIVVVIIGIVATIGVPRIRDAVQKSNERAARAAVKTYIVTARGAAVARGCRSAAVFVSGPNSRMWVTTCRLNAPGRDTIAGPVWLEEEWGVRLMSLRDSITYGPGGMRLNFTSTTVKIRDKKDNERDSVVVNPVGKVIYP